MKSSLFQKKEWEKIISANNLGLHSSNFEPKLKKFLEFILENKNSKKKYRTNQILDNLGAKRVSNEIKSLI